MSETNTPVTPQHDDSSGAPKPKRQKVTIACDECRTKKIKCDGVRPVCQPCHKKYGQDAHCDWSVSTGRGGGISRDYIMQLEDRIRELERSDPDLPHDDSPSTLRASQHVLPQSIPRTNIPPGGFNDSVNYPTQVQPFARNAWADRVTTNGVKRGATSVNGSVSQNTSERSTSGRPQSRGSTLHSPVDPNLDRPRKPGHLGVVSAMMGAVLDEPQSQGFFGGSSAGSFIRQVRNAIDGKIESPQNIEPSDTILDHVQMSRLMPNSTSQQKSNLHYVLPPRKVADSLLAIYWKIVYPLYPYLDRYEVETGYQSLWTGQGPGPHDEPMFLCMLNIIFALSCQLSDSIKPEQREASAEVFFVRAKETLNLNVWQVGSVQSVQAFLLLAQYLQSTNDPHQCWIVVGTAIRTAQSLGLHLPEVSEQVASPRTRELLRKIWHGCVLMDRFLSMTYGRPAMIGKRAAAAVPLPMAIDEQFLSADPERRDSQPRDRPSILDFFIQSLGLYRILNDILLSVYANGSSSNAGFDDYERFFGPEHTDERNCSFLDLDRALSLWQRKLPRHLTFGSNDEIHSRQSVILRQRFLHVKILLLRPTLSRFVTSMDSDSDTVTAINSTLPYRIALQCSIVCVRTAQEAIEHLHSRLPADPNAIGSLAAWWFNVLFIYTAATVLVAARLRTAITSEISEDAINTSWSHAIDILNRYESFSASAQRIVLTLQLLFDKVPERYSQYRSQTQQDTITSTQAPTPRGNFQGLGGLGWPASSPWAPSKLDSVAVSQASGTEMGMEYFDNFDFNFDVNDVSWLNSVPFYQT